ncbi:MAG: hypothetical protein IJY23_08835 [Clostridia bacterium]|nr:hypothetical protein [Clostridia bacterium]
MKKFARILILLLSLALVCSGLIIAVSAEDTELTSTTEDGTSTDSGSVNFIFSHGDVTDGPYECAVGAVPAELFTGTVPDRLSKTEDNHFKSSEHIGWSLTEGGEIFGDEPLTEEYALANSGETVTLYAAYGTPYQKLAWVITEEDGSFVEGGTNLGFDADAWTNIQFTSGRVFIAQMDGVYFADTVTPTNNSSTEKETFYFDMNGHSVRSDWRSNTKLVSTATFFPEHYDTFYIYSSRPGGVLSDVGHTAKGKLSGGYLIRIYGYEDSHVNVGTVTVNGRIYPGSNLTLNGATIVRLNNTCKASSSIKIDGCTVINGNNKTSTKSTALFYSQSGAQASLTVTNSTIVLPYDTSILLQEDSSTDLMTFNNCKIITKTDGASLITNVTGADKVSFINCITNGSIDATGTKTGTVIVKDTAFYSNGFAIPEGCVNAKWNVKMSLGEGCETLIVHTISLPDTTTTSEPNYNEYVIYAASLPILAVKTVSEGDAVGVSWNDFDGNALLTEIYAKGGNVLDAGVLVPDSSTGLKVTKKIFKSWEALPENVQADTDVNVGSYTLAENVTGLRVNLSLYADFGVNLYIPADYAGLVTVDRLELIEVTTADGAKYLKATLEQLCNKTSDAVTFTLNVKEGDFEGTLTASVSIVSYAKAVLEGEFKDADKVLIYYMLTYANEASGYIDGEKVAEITTLLEANSSVASKYTVSSLNETEIIENQNLNGIFTKATIVLNPTPTFAFELVNGFEGTIIVTYAGNKVTETYSHTDALDGYIIVSGMKAYNFGTVLTITAEGTVNGVPVNVENGKYSLETYVAYATGKDEFAASLPLASALRAYAEVSELYKTQALDKAIAEEAES